MRMPINVMSFAHERTDLFKAFADYMNHYRVTYMGATKLEYDNAISFDEKNDKMHNAIIAEINKISGVTNPGFAPEVWATHPTYKWATFAVITNLIDSIIPDTIIDSVGLYTEVRVGGYGDNFAFDIKPSDLFTVTKGSWGKKRSQTYKQFNGQVTVNPFPHDITVGVSLYRVLAGKENLAEFAMKAVRSMETQMTYDVYDAFITTMDAQPTGANGLKVSGYSQDEAIRLAQTVTAFNNGAKAVFVGTQLALQNILPSGTNYRYDIQSDFVKIGYIQTAFGYDCMVLPQVANWTTQYDLKLNDSRIHVMSPSSQKIIKLCIEGSTIAITDDVYQNADLTQNTTMKKSWNTGVATNAKYGEIDLS